MRTNKPRLPPGKVCGQCVHHPRCRWLVGAHEAQTECDWEPGRFTQSSAPQVPRG